MSLWNKLKWIDIDKSHSILAEDNVFETPILELKFSRYGGGRYGWSLWSDKLYGKQSGVCIGDYDYIEERELAKKIAIEIAIADANKEIEIFKKMIEGFTNAK